MDKPILVSTHVRLEEGQIERLHELYPDKSVAMILRELVNYVIKRSERKTESRIARLKEEISSGHDSGTLLP